ncbi:hypothetical protein FNV43_RR18255 [Rhamnella rubrinervis]|uniref:Uncharacterized protein n=1 Tax=Rhamnella rubrinervis TaxID=2594499 RepID=A0A8K0GSR4_9ROSA|nr:hypothetical protein FNV43_RR18255 [Rhamnella rubrinervis]
MKTVSILPALVLLVFIFCLHICFSLSLTVSKHHNFFLSTYEYIVVAKSSRMAVFFMFNIITVIVFFGSFKSSLSTFKGDHFDSYNIYSVPTSSAYEVIDGYGYSSEDEEDEEYQYSGYDGYDEDDENEDDDDDASYYVFNSDDEYGGEDEDGDQLERRIEEFIAKMNGKWREEMKHEKLMMICYS